MALVPYYKNKPYWIFDLADAKRYDKDSNVQAIIDIRPMFIKYSTDLSPSIEEMSSTVIKRADKAPSDAPDVKHPLGILPESPWRNYPRLLYQKVKRDGEDLEHPLEMLFCVAPVFDTTISNELLKLFDEYASLDHAMKSLPIPSQIPNLISSYFPAAEKRPASSDWILKNWESILKAVKDEANDTIKDLGGFWIWLLGIADQKSAKKFEKLYLNDRVTMKIAGKVDPVWNAMIPPPYQRKYEDHVKKQEESGEKLTPPEVDPYHPDYFLNNRVIDVFTDDVKPLKEYF